MLSCPGNRLFSAVKSEKSPCDGNNLYSSSIPPDQVLAKVLELLQKGRDDGQQELFWY
jgi:hypothetical protein